jgi:hypothetical protein
MIEGWQGEDFLILFDEAEAAKFSLQYELSKYLDGYEIVGLKGWDDFIVKGKLGELAVVPTVPLAAEYLTPLKLSIDYRQVKPDGRFCGKVKWYTKPLIFGGDARIGNNMIWVTLEQHAQLVKWWNDLYRKMK